MLSLSIEVENRHENVENKIKNWQLADKRWVE